MNDNNQLPDEPEFSRPAEAESFIHGESEKSFTASPEECQKLAERFALTKLEHLSAQLDIQRRGSGKRIKVNVRGQLDATLEQTCVVSLEPFTSRIRSEFETIFANETDDALENVDLDVMDEDPAEPIIDGFIDLGELISQSLGLEIELHPRKPGLEDALEPVLDANRAATDEDIQAESPFAVLQNLQIKPKN